MFFGLICVSCSIKYSKAVLGEWNIYDESILSEEISEYTAIIINSKELLNYDVILWKNGQTKSTAATVEEFLIGEYNLVFENDTMAIIKQKDGKQGFFTKLIFDETGKSSVTLDGFSLTLQFINETSIRVVLESLSGTTKYVGIKKEEIKIPHVQNQSRMIIILIVFFVFAQTLIMLKKRKAPIPHENVEMLSITPKQKTE